MTIKIVNILFKEYKEYITNLGSSRKYFQKELEASRFMVGRTKVST